MSTSVAGMLNALEYASEEVSPEMTLHALRTFIFVAMRGKCAQKEVEKYLNCANATASRNVSFWTNRKFDRSPGPDFITRVEDDYDRRMKMLTLNKRGQAFYEKLKTRLG